MIRDSVEYLEFTLSDRDGGDLTIDTVHVKLVPLSEDVDTDWLVCTFVAGTTWRTATAITWSTANFPEGSYHAFAKVDDDPETPLCDLGWVRIT